MTTDDEHRRLVADVADSVSYFGDNSDAQRAIVYAIARLPEDVREFAVERCRFISVGAVLGYFLPAKIGLDAFTGSTENVWLVVLSEEVEGEDAESVVAHELAHLWLGHDVSAPGPKWNETEEQACSLVRAWGFSGKGSVHDVPQRWLDETKPNPSPRLLSHGGTGG